MVRLAAHRRPDPATVRRFCAAVERSHADIAGRACHLCGDPATPSLVHDSARPAVVWGIPLCGPCAASPIAMAVLMNELATLEPGQYNSVVFALDVAPD